jgi:hypothetical protein
MMIFSTDTLRYSGKSPMFAIPEKELSNPKKNCHL